MIMDNIVNSNFTFKYVEEDIVKKPVINLPNKSSCYVDVKVSLAHC